VINGVKVDRLTAGGRLNDVFRMVVGMHSASALLGPLVHRDRITMWATNPYGLGAFHVSVRSNPDVVAVINWYGGSLAYQADLAQRIRGFALVGVPLFHTECHWPEGTLYGELLERCDAVVAMTQHEKTFIEQRSPGNNTYAVGAGVDPAAFAGADGNRIRARYGIGDAPLVGYVGRMDPSKGVATLIHAMKSVWQKEPRAHLLLAGGGLVPGAAPRDEVARALAGLTSAERARVITTGPFSDAEKASLYDALDVFAMASAAESFGIAYLEAWMCRKPVIGSRLGSTQCVVDDGRDGVLVSPGNPEELAGAIVRLLSERAAAAQMGRLGHAKTMAHFTWDRITDTVEHIYGEAQVAAMKPRSSGSRARRKQGLLDAKIQRS
jgi:glycosyltransferase involved in cell wall biosynthesis